MAYSPSVTVCDATNDNWEEVLPFINYSGKWSVTDIVKDNKVLCVSISRDFCEESCTKICDIRGEWRDITEYRKRQLEMAPIVKAMYYQQQAEFEKEYSRIIEDSPF